MNASQILAKMVVPASMRLDPITVFVLDIQEIIAKVTNANRWKLYA